MTIRRLIPAFAVLVLAACRSSAPLAPAEVFGRVESKLMQMKSANLVFAADSKGATEVQVSGKLQLQGDDAVIEAKGLMAGAATEVTFTTDATDRPVDLRRAVVVGWTRMGLLHNVVRLLSDQDLEHDSGGIEQWVTIDGVAWDPEERRLSFDVFVEGLPVAKARLWLTREGLPLRRQQINQFEGGEIAIEERYTWH